MIVSNEALNHGLEDNDGCQAISDDQPAWQLAPGLFKLAEEYIIYQVQRSFSPSHPGVGTQAL